MGEAIELRESGAIEGGRRYVKAHELQQLRVSSQVPPAAHPFLPVQQLQPAAPSLETGASSGPASVPPPFPMRPPEVCTVDAPQTPGEVLAVAPSGPGSVVLPLEALAPVQAPAPAAKRGGGGEGNDGSGCESGSGSVVVLDTRAPGRSSPHAGPLAPSSTPSSTPRALRNSPLLVAHPP